MGSGPLTQLDQAWAYARVNGATVAPADGSDIANGGFREGGISGVQRTGAGAYTVTLSAQLDTLQSFLAVSIDAAAAVTDDIHCQHTNDTTILVTAFAAGVAADRSFKLEVRKVKPTTT